MGYNLKEITEGLSGNYTDFWLVISEDNIYDEIFSGRLDLNYILTDPSDIAELKLASMRLIKLIQDCKDRLADYDNNRSEE